MKPIGGYYELELSKGDAVYHTTPYVFKSGRSSMHYLLKLLKPSLVYVPFYTCNGLLESFEAANTKYRFYEIDHLLEPVHLPDLEKDEYFLYINYFDVKRQYVQTLSAKYADKLIVDCTQAFFMKGNGRSWFFNSCRKFFGVPDGSYLYVPRQVNIEPVREKNENYTVTHLLRRFNDHAEEGYPAFLENETLCGVEITGMSMLTEYLLSRVNYDAVIRQRLANYDYLDTFFKEYHLYPPGPADNCVPMVYPVLFHKKKVDREFLYRHKLFVPAFWTDVQERNIKGFETDKLIATHLLPLPIDHRYAREDMDRLVKLIKQLP
jgi:hypothetical protein